MEFRILGPLEVLDDGRPIALGAAKQRALLGALLLQANEVVSTEQLIDALWGEQPPASAPKLVQGYVSSLRNALGPDTIATREPGYVLQVDEAVLDSAQFERRVGEARDLPPEQASDRLREALALWRGAPLAGLPLEGAAHYEAERLNERRLDVLQARIEADLGCRRDAELVAELEALVAQNPLRERLCGQLMLALYRSGRQADALRTYRETRELLVEQLAIEPGAELQMLERAILNHDPALDLPSAPSSRSTPNLPIPPTPLIGRERELAEAAARLRKHRLLTLTGPGGSGKTRLAIELAARAAVEFPDGVFWVALQAVRDPELVLPTIARTVGATDLLADDVRDRTMLLVLDNLEQLLPAAPKVADLLAQVPGLKLLVTSRESLHLAAEHEYPVAPLPEREAVVLFAERATAVNPDFDEEDPAILEVCRRLDCLPLALELAAARVRALSTDELLKRLSRRLPILTGGPRDAPERQRTLRATIAWSTDLLTADEQQVFARLAVFAGGCTLEAAEEICQADLDTLAALVDKSLLRREGARYSLLETIGEFALEQLEETGELEVVRRRHAEYYLNEARALEDLIRSPQAAALLDRLERDHDNFRAALAWVADSGQDRPVRLAVWGLAARLHSFGDAALDRGNLAEAARLYRESLQIGLQLKDDMQTAYCLGGLAAVAARRGTPGPAARLWGGVHGFERAAGMPLHDAERSRYERVIGEPQRASQTAAQFAQGREMALDDVVAYALSLD